MITPKPIKPKEGQESVWDYPRPPKVERTNKSIEVHYKGKLIASTNRAFRVLETSHPPVYYIPPEDVDMKFLQRSDRESYCEWKGRGGYYHVIVDNKKEEDIAWDYEDPKKGFEQIKDHIAFFAKGMDKCLVDGEEVSAQPGNFYGGWITKDIVGPFKGVEGSWGW